MMIAISLLCTPLALSLLAGAAPTPRQDRGPDVSGRVLDTAGGPIPGAGVVLTLDRERRETRTNDDGAYSFWCVPDGNVTLRFSLRGMVSISAGPMSLRYPRGIVWDQTMEVAPGVGHEYSSARRLAFRVTDEEGRPVALREVSVAGLGFGETDHCGRFEISVGWEKDGVVESRLEVSGYAAAPLKVDLSRGDASLHYALVLSRRH